MLMVSNFIHVDSLLVILSITSFLRTYSKASSRISYRMKDLASPTRYSIQPTLNPLACHYLTLNRQVIIENHNYLLDIQLLL